MKKYTEMSETELKEQLAVLTKEYEAAKAKGLKLDMSRGKPSPAQLDVSNEMLDIVNSETGCVSPTAEITVLWKESLRQDSLWAIF